MRFVRDLFVLVGITLAFVFFAAGCETQHHVDGGQNHEIHVKHDNQKVDIYIHKNPKREARKHPQPKE